MPDRFSANDISLPYVIVGKNVDGELVEWRGFRNVPSVEDVLSIVGTDKMEKTTSTEAPRPVSPAMVPVSAPAPRVFFPPPPPMMPMPMMGFGGFGGMGGPMMGGFGGGGFGGGCGGGG